MTLASHEFAHFAIGLDEDPLDTGMGLFSYSRSMGMIAIRHPLILDEIHLFPDRLPLRI